MTTPYRIGYNFERRVRFKLEKLGYWVGRQGKSAFPDFVAVNKDNVFFAECKSSKKVLKNPIMHLSPDERSRAFELIDNTLRPFFLVYKNGRQISIMALGGLGTAVALFLEDGLNARGKSR